MTNEQKVRVRQILELVNRSPDGGDRWRVCVPKMWFLMQEIPDSLAETVEFPNGGGVVRLTEKGMTVLEFGP